MVFQQIPLASGTASSPVTYDIGESGGGYWVDVIGWRSGEIWFVGTASVHVVDYETGTAKNIWP